MQPKLAEIGAVKISSYLVTVDKTANKIFNKWSNFIHKNQKNRKLTIITTQMKWGKING